MSGAEIEASFSEGREGDIDKCIRDNKGHILHSVSDVRELVLSEQDTNINNRRDSVDG